MNIPSWLEIVMALSLSLMCLCGAGTMAVLGVLVWKDMRR